MSDRNTMTPEELQKTRDYLRNLITSHADHAWQQIGCHTCNVRLYQGSIPESHTKVVTRSWDDAVDPAATKTMRERWGKP